MMKGDKREIIIEAATAIFARDGFDRAKMEDISIQAGIGKGTIYEYFKSKKELFQEVIKNSISIYVGLLKDVGTEEQPFDKKLADFIRLHKEFLEKNRDLANLLMKDTRGIPDGVKKHFLYVKKEAINAAVNMIDSAIQHGEVRDIKRRIGARIILGITISLVTAGFMEDEDWNVDDVVDIILNGISR
ncbi:TetR/AcrR family transcriptional regulator [Calorimonas adulescens]|uniref:TetR/AcrR family transcriptional regulator n=1 Tax=Calorimonas adulescens TaxID=2606906 RepID=A0A5D8QER6_9THEO|nr:TetR/AcrR family transcriptional regulator [Calorimonas adulescens]TZE82907.1 TetR/AcrR family transcriptional regulator [Calorimonas adulescens]